MSAFSPHATYPTIFSGVVQRQPGATVSIDQVGLAIAQEKFIGRYADMVAGKPLKLNGTALTLSITYRSPDPFIPSLALFSSKISLRKGLADGLLEVEYRGVNPAYGGNNLPAPVYSLERSTSTEPLSTHPLWNNKSGNSQSNFIAGTPSSPQNGAIFVNAGSGIIDSNDSQDVFKGFALTSSFYGVESYLVPGQVWTSSYLSFSPPSSSDLAGVGTIQGPDGSPPTPKGYQWLYLGLRYTDNAGLYRIDKSWRCFKENFASSYLYKVNS